MYIISISFLPLCFPFAFVFYQVLKAKMEFGSIPPKSITHMDLFGTFPPGLVIDT